MTTAPTLITLLSLLGLANTGRYDKVVLAKPVRTKKKAPAIAPVDAAQTAKLAGTFPPKNSTPVAPDLGPLAWEAPLPMMVPFTLGPEPRRGFAKQSAIDPAAQRIRERYLAARFPGVLKTATDLADTDRIVKSARLLFEDGHAARAGELLDLASEAHPEYEGAWLANLEIAFLDHDAERYARLAHAFHGAHPDSSEWPEVKRLGRRIAPMHPRFAGESSDAPEDFDHSGPWPRMPNWIQANWDLTGDVAAVELRSRLLAGERVVKPAYSAAA